MATLIKEMDHSAYHAKVRIRGYTNPVTVFQAVTNLDAARVLRRAYPAWGPDDHKALARQHETAAQNQTERWNQLVDEAANEVWGRDFQFCDYRISGIASDEFPEHLKDALRFCAHAASSHRALAKAHDRAASNYRRRQ